MRNLNHLNEHRIVNPLYGGKGDERNGAFEMVSPDDGAKLYIIASSGEGWDHVSVSRDDRIPSWTEMEFAKRQFFRRDDCAMQLHPPVDEYIDGSFPGKRSINCLHLWRPLRGEIPRPPRWMVGAMNEAEAKKLYDQGKWA